MKTNNTINLRLIARGFVKAVLILLLLIPVRAIAQTQGPAVKWAKQEYSPSQWNGQPKLDPSDPNYKQSDEWWYAHTKVYENGVQIGYAATGYSSWSDATVASSDQNNCWETNPALALAKADCQDFETPASVKGAFFQTIALYNMEGEMQWCKRFNAGEFHDIIQGSDGNLVAIGQTVSVKYLMNPGSLTPIWEDVNYNPTTSSTSGTGVYCSQVADFKGKTSVVKVDLQGNKLWNFMYGHADVTTPNWERVPTAGWGLTEFDNGYRIVGNDDGKGQMMQLNLAGEIVQKDVFQPTSSLLFFQVESGDGHLAVTGRSYAGSVGGFVYHFPASNTFLQDATNFQILTSVNHTQGQSRTVIVEWLEEFQLFAIPVFYNGTFGTWNGHAECEIQFFEKDFDPQAQVPSPIYAGNNFGANDLKMGITDISGGFATVSSKQPGDYLTTRPAYTPQIIGHLQSLFGNPVSCIEYYDPAMTQTKPIDANGYIIENTQYWDSDANVARYDINPSNFNVSKRWEKTFDADGLPRQNYPGDIKKQECLYTITTDDRDGSVVIAGNTSNNLDDTYFAKLYPDDCIGSGLVYDVENTSTGTTEITANTTWDNATSQIQGHQGELYVKGEVIVKSGWTLTVITNQVFMSADYANGKKGRFFIEKGARLIVDGATITSDIARCAKAEFDGITIDGDNGSNQTIGANGLIANQGLLELTNYATLDNAKYAIRFGSGAWNDFGGVVQANDATIRATRRAVEFMQYPGQNASYFNRCDFEYAGDFTAGKLPLVTLWGVRDVKFYGCNFTDNTNRDIYSEYGNSGIFSMDAVYQVLPGCVTGLQNCATKTVRSSFNNLNQGVYAFNDVGQITNMVSIESADFNQNAIGFRVLGTDGTRFIKNNVTNGGIDKVGFNAILGNNYFGYRSDNAKDFTIEQNTFEKVAPGSVNEPTVGVNIRQAGAVANEVYNNSFKGQDIGQKFDGTNRNGNFEGLSFRCNTNPVNNLSADVNVTATSSIFNGPDGIKTIQQGAMVNESAGNQFSAAPFRILNNSSSNIQYKHTGGSENPTPSAGPVSATTLNVSSNTCNTRFLFRNNLGHLRLPNNYVAEYYTKRYNYDNLLYALHQNIDNGNTDSLQEEINLFFPHEAQQMRNELMVEAPYLSQEALMQAAESGILTDGLLLEICLANPEATYGEEFLNFVEYEIPNPLPSNYITLIYQNWETETARTILENQLSVLNDDLGLMSKNILNYYVEDTLDWKDSVENIIASKKNLPSKYDLVELATSQNNFTLANSRLNTIANNYELSDAQAAEHSNLEDYLVFRENRYNEGLSMMQLNENHLTELVAIANAVPGRTAALARSVLCFGYQDCESDFPTEPLGRKKKAYTERVYDFDNEINLTTQVGLINGKLKVYPNPTNNEVTVELNEFDNNATYLLEVRSLEGKVLINKELLNNKLVLSTNNIAAGNYLLLLLKNGELSAETILVKQ